MATPDYTAHYRLPIPQFNSVPWHQQWEDSLRAVDEALYLSTITTAPAWQNDKDYFVGNMALDTAQGTLWVCRLNHTSLPAPVTFAAQRAAAPTLWQGISTLPTFRGNWQTGVTYNANDFVLSGSKYAVATVAHISGASFAADEAAGKWEVLVDTGQAFVAINDLASESIAAAVTTDLGSKTASRVLITGIAPGGNITSLGTAPNTFKIVRFGSAGNTIVHNGVSLQLPDGQSIAAQANDIFYFMSDTVGNWLLWGMLRKFTQTDFDDIKQPATLTYSGVVELATTTETVGLADTTRAVTPGGLSALVSSTTTRGLPRFATDAEAQARFNGTVALTPANLAALDASVSQTGIVELATDVETRALADTTKAVTPSNLGGLTASTAQRGIVELATVAETQLGTDATRAVTPASLAGTIASTVDSGVVRLATDAEVAALTTDAAVVTPGGLGATGASTAQRGIVQMATDAETALLTTPSKAISPSSLGSLDATVSQRGIVELADATETRALSAANRAVTPAGLGALGATTTQIGVSRLATTAEAQAKFNGTVSLTPSNLADVTATRGQIESSTGGSFIAAADLRYATQVAKAYASANVSGGLIQGYNISSVVDGGPGIVQLGISPTMSSVSYTVVTGAMYTVGADFGTVVPDALLTTAFNIKGFNQAGTLTDPTRWHAVVFGIFA